MLRPFSLLPIIERASGIGMHPVEDDVQVRMRGIVVGGIDGLVAVPAHRLEKAVGRRDHLRPARGLPRRPGEADGLDGGIVLAPLAAQLR